MNVSMKATVERLRELAAGASPESTCVGLCSEMKQYPIKVQTLALGWSKHSGNECFPIPATGGQEYDALDAYSWTMNLWSGEQGKLRRELCSYIADKLDKKENKYD